MSGGTACSAALCRSYSFPETHTPPHFNENSEVRLIS